MDELSDQSLSAEIARPRLPSKWVPGQIIQGRYKVVRELGRGGMGIVLEVENVLIRKKCALKLIESASTSPMAVRRLQREAKVLSELDHANIVKALDFDILEDNTPFVLMELIQGGTLSDYLKNRRPLNEDEAKRLFLPILDALAYAHFSGVVHRDLKPTNIMLVGSGDALQPKLLDFGLALPSELTAEALTRDGSVLGTPLYMSPEQVSNEDMTNKSDIYSLGCVIFEALTGAPPFAGRTPMETLMMHKSSPVPSLSEASMGGSFSPRMETILKKMLAKNPNDRYQSCAAVIDALKGTSAPVNKSNTVKQPVLIVLPLVLLVVACLVGLHFYHDQGNVSQKATPDLDDLVHRAAAQASFGDRVGSTTTSADKSPTKVQPTLEDDSVGRRDGAGLVIDETTKGREFSIVNSSATVGNLRWIDGSMGNVRHELTRTPMLVPNDAKLWFEPEFEALRNPLILPRFEKAHLAGMIIRPSNGEGIFLQEKLSDCLRLIPDEVPGLMVDKMVLTPKDVRSIAKLTDVDWLELKEVSIDDAAALTMPRVFKSLKLDSFALAYIDNTPTSQKALSDSLKDIGKTNATRLCLTSTSVDKQMCTEIAKLQNLSFLNVSGSFSRYRMDSALQDLGPLPHLQVLVVNAKELTDLAIAQMEKLKSLKRLYVNNADQISASQAKSLRALHCQVIYDGDVDIGFEPLEDSFQSSRSKIRNGSGGIK